jgi:hypothetical protein
MSEGSRDDSLPFALGLKNGFEVILFGYCNHANCIIRRGVKCG